MGYVRADKIVLQTDALALKIKNSAVINVIVCILGIHVIKYYDNEDLLSMIFITCTFNLS